MTHVNVTLLPSLIGPFGVCVIVGNVVGASKDQNKIHIAINVNNFNEHILYGVRRDLSP
jgi:hypothetical protein